MNRSKCWNAVFQFHCSWITEGYPDFPSPFSLSLSLSLSTPPLPLSPFSSFIAPSSVSAAGVEWVGSHKDTHQYGSPLVTAAAQRSAAPTTPEAANLCDLSFTFFPLLSLSHSLPFSFCPSCFSAELLPTLLLARSLSLSLSQSHTHTQALTRESTCAHT